MRRSGETLDLPHGEVLAPDQLIVEASESQFSKHRGPGDVVEVDQCVDLSAGESLPCIEQHGVAGFGGDPFAPIATTDDHRELDGGTVEISDALESALAEEGAGYGVSYRPQAPPLCVPASFVGMQQIGGGRAVTGAAVDVMHHAGVGVESGRFVEICARKGQQDEALGA